jgi:DNA-directed RNA polymerase specialized sigma24 family protein
MVGEDNKARFDALVVPHLAEALTLARWLARNQADAEDIVQEACLRAFRAIDSFSGGSARAWVLTIVRRTAYSWLSKNRVPALVAVDDLNPRERTWAEHGGDGDTTDRATPETELIGKTDAARSKQLSPRFQWSFGRRSCFAIYKASITVRSPK